MEASDASHGDPDLELGDPSAFEEWASDEEKVSLVMLSGGIDSTFNLVRLLSETKHRVLAHHINFINDEERYDAESKSVHRIIELCEKRYRPFLYSETAIDHTGMPFFGFDVISVGFEAGIVAHSYKEAYGKMIDGWTIGTCLEEGHDPNRFKFAKACCAANCFPEKAPPFFMLPLETKVDQMKRLPAEILESCWTCRRPIRDGDSFKECGECKTCVLVRPLRESLKA